MAHSKKCVESCLKLTRILCDMDIKTFLTELSDFDDDRNYAVFMVFAEMCSSNVLAILFRLGYFVGHCEILRIAGKIIETRSYSNKNEDVAGHIAFLLLSYHHMLENVKNTVKPKSSASARPIAIVRGVQRPAAENNRGFDISISRKIIEKNKTVN